MTTMTCTPMTDAELARLGTREDASFGCLETSRGHLPMTAMNVEARVQGLACEIELAQTFENTLAEPIEATYIFPLPDRAAVTRFRMEVAGRVIEGVIDERGRAREQYEVAIAAGHRAAITEEDRAGVFTLRVGNLMPSEVATIRLTLIGPLPIDDGEVTFRFPLVVAPRYIPGKSLPGPRAGTGTADDTDATPDASRITPPVLLPGVPNPVRLGIAVTVDGAGVPVGDLRSSLHAITETLRAGVRKVEIQPGERLDRDFILRWTIGDAEIRSGAVATADADGEGGTVIVTLVPPRSEEPSRPRDVVFVLDRSGSMGGWKMVAARRAVARMVDTLGERDRFAVMAFDDRIEVPPSLPAASLASAGDRNRFRAVEFLAAIDARGGTEMREPLVRGAEMLAGGYEDRDRILVLVTDGQVGNEDQILRELGKRLKNVRVFTLGVDQAVNEAFLKRLAAAGGGACELVESEDRLDTVMAKVHRRIATPVVTELAIRGEGLAIDAASIAPQRLPALFVGAPVMVAARLQGRAGGSVVVTGRTPSGQPWSQQIPVVTESRGDAAAAIWARARIRDLEDRYAAHGGGADLEREIVAVSLKHRVLSRFTAFLAFDRSEKVNPKGNPKTITQAVEMPAGWELERSAGRNRMAMPAMAPMKSLSIGSAAPMAMPPGAPPIIHASAAMPPPAPMGAPQQSKMRGGGGPGLFQKAKQLFSREEKTAVLEVDADMPVVDLAPYRKRAKDLADAVERAGERGDRSGLDLALARIDELVEDLKSVGGADDLAAAIDRCAATLRGGDWRAAAEELRRIGEGASVPPAPRPGGRAFWK
jgi:Ca-activated chloride channel homolog